MDFNAVAEKITNISSSYVRLRLNEETQRLNNDPETTEVIKNAIKNFTDHSSEMPREMRNLVGKIKSALSKPLGPPNKLYIRDQAEQDGRFLASSWLQMLAYPLEELSPIQLDDGMLPIIKSEELWQAWRENINQMLIENTDIKEILIKFVKSNMTADSTLMLPLGTLIRETNGAYIAEVAVPHA